MPYKDEGCRPILGLRDLNIFLYVRKFAILSLEMVLAVLKVNCWFCILDLQGTDFHIESHPVHHRFLCFKYSHLFF